MASVGGVYVPPAFAEDRRDVVVDLVRQAGFGHVVVVTDDGLVSTPVPLVVDDELASMRAHVARPNRIWRSAPCDALVVVPVADAYVSPSWYPSKAAHGEVVPTWNYEVVHLHGRLVAHDDVDWVYQQVTDLTDTNEAHLPEPWAVADAPQRYVAKLQRGIVGIEVIVDRVEAKRKLGQNRDEADRIGAHDSLKARDARSARVAEAMGNIEGRT